MKTRKWFVLFLGIQIIMLSLMGLSWFVTGAQGKEIRLQTEVVDPHDIFYGDYLALGYKVNKVSSSLWKAKKEDITRYKKRSVYVTLIQKKGLWEVDGVYTTKPHVSKQRVVLNAFLNSVNDQSELNLTYGIERFYVQEQTGLKWEKMKEPLVAVVKLSPWGQVRVMKIQGLKLENSKKRS